MDNLAHADAVASGIFGGGLARPHPVSQPRRGQRPQQVPDIQRDIVGLEDVAPRCVERVGHLRELQQLLEVGHRAVTALAVDPHERRAVGGTEDHVVAAHDEISLGVARVQ